MILIFDGLSICAGFCLFDICHQYLEGEREVNVKGINNILKKLNSFAVITVVPEHCQIHSNDQKWLFKKIHIHTTMGKKS